MNRHFAFAATTALLGSATLSQAAVITTTANYAASTDWGTSSLAPNFTPTYALTVGGFDPALGTLTGVVVKLTSGVTGTIKLTNNGSTPTAVSGYLSDIESNIFPDGSTATLYLTSNAFQADSLAGHSTAGPQAVADTSTPSVNTFTSDLGAFDNSWTLLAGDFGSVNVTSANGNGSAVYTDTSAVHVAVQYTYTPSSFGGSPTPEPTTFVLLGSGLAGLWLLRRGSMNWVRSIAFGQVGCFLNRALANLVGA